MSDASPGTKAGEHARVLYLDTLLRWHMAEAVVPVRARLSMCIMAWKHGALQQYCLTAEHRADALEAASICHSP